MPGWLGTIFQDLKKSVHVTVTPPPDMASWIPPELQGQIQDVVGVTKAKNQTLLLIAGVGLVLAIVLVVTRGHR